MLKVSTPTADKLRRVGRYWTASDPAGTREMKANHGLRTLADVGRYIWECDPDGFDRAAENGR